MAPNPNSDSPGQPGLFRIWPALLILAVMWGLIFVPGWIVPLTMIHFISMQIGPPLGCLGLAIWWLTSRHLSWRSRLIGLGAAILTVSMGMVLAHGSLTMPMLVYGLPIALSVLVLCFWLTNRRPWPVPGRWALGSLVLMMVAVQFLRVGQIDAAFRFDLVPRWRSTAEAAYLRSLEESEPGGETSMKMPAEASADDWPAFRGGKRDGVVRGVTFDVDWAERSPVERWRRSIGPGWSSFCVVGPLAITQEQRGQAEAVSAFSVDDGTPIWSHETPGRFEAAMGGIGPRATPTFDEGRLYTTGASGLVQCLDAANGKPVWGFDLVDDFGANVPEWGFAASPLVGEELVYVVAGAGPGKGLVALHRDSGTLAWSAGDGSHTYSSAQSSSLHGVDQILVSTNRGVHSITPDSGAILWSHVWDIGTMARITQPLVRDDTVFLGTGYGNGTARIEIQQGPDRWFTEETWIAPLKPYFNDFVDHQGYLYGFDGPIFMCVDMKTGERIWKRGRYGHGQVLLIEDMECLLVLCEDGRLVLLDATPDGHQERASFAAISGVTWNHPVIAGGKLLVRNGQEMACYDLHDFRNIASDRGSEPKTTRSEMVTTPD